MRPSQIYSIPPTPPLLLPPSPVEMLEAGVVTELPDDPPTRLADQSYDAEKVMEDFISLWVSLLENLEKYYEASENGSIMKNHVQSMKNGVDFLGKLCLFTFDGNLANRISVSMKHDSLTICGDKKEDLQRIRINLDNIFLVRKSFNIFYQTNARENYGRIIDFLLENISIIKTTWYNSSNATADGHTVAIEKKLGELRLALTYYKPLCVCFAHSSQLLQMNTSLDSVLDDAAFVIYFLFTDSRVPQTAVDLLDMMIFDVKELRLSIYEKFLKGGSLELTYQVTGGFYIPDNLIHILATNSDAMNEPNKHLYEELKELPTVVGGSGMLFEYLELTETQSICYQALHIVSSIYIEEDVHRKLDYILNSVVRQIRLIKLRYGSQEIKLYDYPRVDGMGFLKYFLGYLKELQQQNILSVIWSKIETLHMDIECIVSSLKTFDEKLPSGKLWTHIVRLAYEAEYVIDLYLVIPDSCCVSTLSKIVEEVKEKKEKVFALADKRLHEEDVALTTSTPIDGISLYVNNAPVGFQEEIVAIRKDLLTGESDLQVISIVGMGGAGKTSLAKHLFEECSHDGHFDKNAWCTASQTYQMKDLLHTLLAQIDPSENRDIDEQTLADTFCRSLKGRRYLVVIDDVWDVGIWNYLGRYFPDGKTQSRVLITTRDYNVALEPRSTVHHLRPLTKDESWELLQKMLTQQETEESLPRNFESIAKEVAMSCKGLPLPIVIIGSLLHHATRNEEVWNQIAKDVTSTILSDPVGKCEAILELSYNYLPDNLKACFLYLAIFPEDHEISVNRLVRLWVAEGFVRRRIASDVSMEVVGKTYMNHLLQRNLVIQIKEKREGGVKTFQLHDLLRDFCLKKAEDEHFFTVLGSRGTFHSSPCPRRMTIDCGKNTNLPSLCWNSVRTVISLNGSSEIEQIMKSKGMLLLNVLDVHELSESASQCLHHFIHLRYLAVWKLDRYKSFFEESSFSKLLNLQVLILHFSVYSRIRLPDFIWDLVKLKHIDIRRYSLFSHRDSKKVKDSTVLLENLESLSRVELVHEDENWLRKLPKLQKLSCKLQVSFVESCQQYRFPKLDLCNRLTSLKVECICYGEEWTRCKLHLPASLRKLRLMGLKLDSDAISEIGKSLPNLEELELYNSVQSWSSTDEDFPKLKILQISYSHFCEWDVSEDSFPKLEQLWLLRCPFLQEIPLTFADNLNLRLISIGNCNSSLCQSARQIEKRQLEALNTELKLIL